MSALLESQGEVPRSGGGEATSGAGAKRKEGVQPPDDRQGEGQP